jgi:hypothetical protein
MGQICFGRFINFAQERQTKLEIASGTAISLLKIFPMPEAKKITDSTFQRIMLKINLNAVEQLNRSPEKQSFSPEDKSAVDLTLRALDPTAQPAKGL